MLRVPSSYRAVRRSNALLDARDPSLINLPLPVDSIPVLGPILSPIIGDGNGGSTPQPTPTPNPNPNPNPSPSPAPATGGNSGGSGGSNNGSGGGGSPPPTSPPVVSANGGGPAIPPSPRPTPPSSDPGKGSPGASGGGSMSSGTGVNTISGENSLASGGGSTGAVKNDAGPGSSPTNAVAAGGSAITGAPVPSQSLLRSGSHTTGVASPQSAGSGTSNTSGKLLSGGAIAGIVILCLLFLSALILLIIRRRSITRRMELRQQWFGHHAFNRRFSGFDAARRSAVEADRDAQATDRRSTRSSFATTYDQGLAIATNSEWPSVGAVPDLPPIAQVRERSPVLMSTGGATTRRDSLNSMLSNGSDPDAQYLIYSTDHNVSALPSPMSVRPFSPSESFSFPKPPPPPTGNADSFYIASLRSSTATLVNLTAPSRIHTTPPLCPQALIPGVFVSPPLATAHNFTNPFADPMKPENADAEVVHRSHEPLLDDELRVRTGDHVRVLRVFDDGWALVERLGDTKGERCERGSIPIDCLSSGNQTSPVFFAL